MKQAFCMAAVVVFLAACGTETQPYQPVHYDTKNQQPDTKTQNVCNPTPCKNGGTCLVVAAFPGYQCNCAVNWQGPTCEQSKNTQTCTPNEAFCQTNILFTCKPDGTAWVQISCPNGCQNSVCKGNCQPGTQSCMNQKQLQKCDINGNITVYNCTGVCQGNQCSEDTPLCEANKQFCTEGSKLIYLCNNEGTNAAQIKQCPFGCDPLTVDCKSSACQIGQKRCAPENPNFVETCLPDQSGWQKAPTACKDGCINGECFQPLCEAGQKKCGADSIVICKNDKTGWEEFQKCAGNCFVDGNGIPTCGLCLQGTKKCDWYTVQTCKSATEGWVNLLECNATETCAEGECVSMIFLDASNSKEQNYKVLIEAMAVCFHQKINGACTGINTKAITYGITKGDLKTWFCDNYEDAAFKSSFNDNQIYEDALDIVGCQGAFTNISDLTMNEAVKAGQDGKQCIAFSNAGGLLDNKKQIIVDSCEKF